MFTDTSCFMYVSYDCTSGRPAIPSLSGLAHYDVLRLTEVALAVFRRRGMPLTPNQNNATPIKNSTFGLKLRLGKMLDTPSTRSISSLCSHRGAPRSTQELLYGLPATHRVRNFP